MDHPEGPQHDSDSEGDSSSDENDSAAAAHAAAIGHSPQPLPLKVIKSEDSGDIKSAPGIPASESKEAPGETSPGVGKIVSETAMEVSPAKPETTTKLKSPTPEEQAEGGSRDSTPEEKATVLKKPKEPKFYCPYNLNERDTDENTPLHVAILARKLEHVKLLVEAGASVHKKCDGSPPIHTAISMGSIEKHAQFAYDCVVFLVQNGVDLSSKDDAMHTPLYLACMCNLPDIVNFILSNEQGVDTLNMRSDRSQGRALHAAAKFDVPSAKGPTTAVAPGHPRIPQLHTNNSVAGASLPVPGFSGTLEPSVGKVAPTPSVADNGSSPAPVTQMLLKTPGIEVDATNSVGQTPLHIACSRGNWTVVRLLLQAGANADIADRRGFTPGQHAHKRGMFIPNDLLQVLGGPPSSGTVAPPRDLIVDPDSNTLLLTHELCGLHRTCAPIRRDPNADPPPENVRRLAVLADKDTGILRTGEFGRCTWENETRRAAMADVLKVRLGHGLGGNGSK